MERSGFPGRRVEAYRAGIIATAAYSFTGFQHTAGTRAESNGKGFRIQDSGFRALAGVEGVDRFTLGTTRRPCASSLNPES
jgi:hypothetical protein